MGDVQRMVRSGDKGGRVHSVKADPSGEFAMSIGVAATAGGPSDRRLHGRPSVCRRPAGMFN
nr:hypothetical protein [Methylocapsa sp. RX1]